MDPGAADDPMTVDLSFYATPWYHEFVTGTDAQSCFSEGNGQGADNPPPARRNNLTGDTRPLGDRWNRDGYLEGEDACQDTGDFTVDFDDRGQDGDQSDGTDWGEDDNTPKCGLSGVGDGQWFIFIRESCGNGMLDAGEACDDGNLAAGDGCSPTCALEYRSCLDALAAGEVASRPYTLYDPPTHQTYDVYCDLATDGGGWTLVASSLNRQINDEASAYYADLTTLAPAAGHRGIWRGLQDLQPLGDNWDVRFTCRMDPGAADEPMTVDLSFYATPWYHELVAGTDADSCFNEAGGENEVPARRDNVSGETRPAGDPWDAGRLVGEDRCDSLDDFTVDFDDHGLDSNQGDGTDWGYDDGVLKCGANNVGDGQWFLFVRETCGNGRLDVGEACDDANRVAGDGCDAACAVEP
ncbi:MAG: hypothetical protein H6706_09025 [Myxococcales bacterium]|nr:hypothetical protein [Myxococcales bacterium]